MSHWQFLLILMDHRWRRDKQFFDGTQEMNHSLSVSTAVEIMRQLGGVEGCGENTEDWSGGCRGIAN
jgi:hypothetical protein